MREIADLPGGYDRVDRHGYARHGQQQIADPIRPDKQAVRIHDHDPRRPQPGRHVSQASTAVTLTARQDASIRRLNSWLPKKSYDIEAVRRLAIESRNRG